MTHEILVIEDDQVLNRLVADHLRRTGHAVISAFSWREAEDYLKRREPSLLLMDVRLPDADGLALLAELTRELPVMVLTAYGSVRDAVQAMKAGAADYLVKPVDLEELEVLVERVLRNAALRDEHLFCKRQLEARRRRKTMVGESRALRQVLDLIEVVAPSDLTVLIQGESGVGKELAARAVHERSPRAARNFVVVDCCTLQQTLFESELFGHEKGAFTGADRQKKGLIEGAEGGTLFLDEIGEIDGTMQSKLLRVLETGRFRRVGGTRDLNANVRVTAATNRDLAALSRAGEFRADLYYRLSGFTITVPPLRDRREDIPPLVAHFLEHHKFSRRLDKKMSSSALRALTSYDWPGNIRELKNVVERAVILSRDEPEIRPEQFSQCLPAMRPDSVVLSFDHPPTMDEIEHQYLNLLLKRYQGHRQSVATTMGVSPRNIYRLVQKHGFKH